MKTTRKFFTQDYLVNAVKMAFSHNLKRLKIPELHDSSFSNLDCLMSGLAVFTLKYPSLLKFDKHRNSLDLATLQGNILRLFGLTKVPCDTQMRTRLDKIPFSACRLAFTRLFTILQRGKILDNFRFLNKYYLVSLDGTGVFSSSSVHCKNCCIKKHRDGSTTYHHQLLCGALVHPEQSVVFPLAPEPIIKTDGQKKNDCERNAAKRWLKDFKREHPHLNAVILADGLSSNAPFIREIQSHKLYFLLICKDADHKYLLDCFESADETVAPRFSEIEGQEVHSYHYMKDVPLNKSNKDLKVSVVRYKKTKKGKTTTWMWVTDLAVNKDNVREIVKGGLARWKIENETFNTLKNQGYQFEHNFGHGNEYLHTVFAHLMLLAFFIDQCLQRLNKRFNEAYRTRGSKRSLWEKMRGSLEIWTLPNFETLYDCMVRAPPEMKIIAVT